MPSTVGVEGERERAGQAGGLDHLSASSISLYLRCPEAWRRKYVCDEPEPVQPGVLAGIEAHAYLEKVMRAGLVLGVEWRPDEWRYTAPRPEGAVQEAIYHAVLRTDAWRPLECEAEWSSVRPGGYLLVGRVDAICERDGNPFVLELKTHTHATPPSRRALWDRYWLQFALYSWARGMDHVCALTVSVRSGRLAERWYRVGQADTAFALRTADTVWDAVRWGRFEPTARAWVCRTCGYGPTCPHRKEV